MSYQTLDIDRNTDKKFLDKILQKIRLCKKLESFNVKISPSLNGIHITLFCDINCYICRLCYDDRVRLSRDLENRKPHERNVLFQEKTLIMKNHVLVLKEAEI